MKQLAATECNTLEKKLSVEKAKQMDIPKVELTEQSFRWEMNEDVMATDKLADGIRKFAADLVKLEKVILEKLQ